MPLTAFLPTPGLLLAAVLAVVPTRMPQAAESAPNAPAAAATAPAPAPEAESVSPAATAALAQLLGLTAAEPAAATAAAAAEARTTTTVREGETLDRIIRRTMGNTPFKDSLLQAAFVEVNPRAYPNGSIQRLPVGTVLNVPSAADLRRHLVRVLGAERAAALAAATPGATAPAGHAGHAPTAAARPASASAPPAPPRPDHRGWVRFPG